MLSLQQRVDSFRPEVAADTFGDEEVDDAIANAAAEISGEAAAERAEAPDGRVIINK